MTELSSQFLFLDLNVGVPTMVPAVHLKCCGGEKKRKTKTIGALEYSINLFMKRPSKYFCTFICKINVKRRQNCWDVDAQNPLLH